MKNLSNKNKQSTKEIHPTQTITEEKIQTTGRSKNYLPYLVAIICITSLYSFEFLNNFSDDYINALNSHKTEKKRRTNALNKVKEAAKETTEYQRYLEAKKTTDIAWENFNIQEKQESFFGFKSAQLFLAEFGPMFCFFCYALFNLFRSFFFERKNHGMKVLHGLIISGTMFYFFWIFQQFQDFSKATYYLMTFLSTVIIVFSVGLITKYQNHYINKLKADNLELSIHAIRYTVPGKKEEILKRLEKITEEIAQLNGKK